jgi:outer membrane autotransporter protein
MVNKSERKRQLAVSVTLGLLLACGGHHHCLAADYDGGRFTVNNKQVTYDNVTVATTGPYGTGYEWNEAIAVTGTNSALTANKGISITMHDTADGKTYDYTGLVIGGANKVTAVEGINITIDGKGKTDASSWGGFRSGININNNTSNTATLELGENSLIKIDTMLDTSYTNAIYLTNGQITGGNLAIEVNKDLADTQSGYTGGIYVDGEHSASVEVTGTLSLDLTTAGVAVGIDNNIDGADAGFTVSAKTLEIKVQSLGDEAKGIYGGYNGVNNKITAENTIINVTSKSADDSTNAYGASIDNTLADFGSTQITVTSDNGAAEGLNGGMGSEIKTKDLTINVTAQGQGEGISLLKSNLQVDGAAQINVSGNDGMVQGLTNHEGTAVFSEAAAPVKITAKNTTNTAYGIYNYYAAKTDFYGDAEIKADGASGSYAVYARDNNSSGNNKVVFHKGLKAEAVNGDVLDADGGSIIVNAAGGNDVQLVGEIVSGKYYKNSNVSVNFDTADSFLKGAANTYSTSNLDLSFTNGAGWQLTGDSAVNTLSGDADTVIDMTADGGSSSKLQLGNIAGNGLNFVIDVAADQADTIYTYRSKKSSHNLSLQSENLQTIQQAAANKVVVAADYSQNLKYNSNSALDFGGIYEYRPELASKLVDGKNEWYVNALAATMNRETAALNSANEVVYGSWRNSIDTLQQRLGEVKLGAENGIWVRTFGGESAGDTFKNKYHTYQIGYDITTDDSWILGLAYEYMKGNVSYDSGNGDNSLGAVSLYGTKLNKDGSSLDIVAKRGHIHGDVDAYGRRADSMDYKTDATSLSVEYGKRITCSSDWYVEPQVQMTYGRINGYDYVSDKGIRTAYDDMDSLIGRIGFAVGKQYQSGTLYFKASALHEFCGSSTVNMIDKLGETYTSENDYGDTWFELGLGGSVALSKNSHLYGDVERSFGADIQKKWQVNAGLRFSF